HATLVLIEDLHLLRVESRFVEEIGGGETLIERVTRDKIPETDLHERAQIAGSAMGEVHDAARLAVDHEDVSFANVCGFHGSGNINRPPWHSKGPSAICLSDNAPFTSVSSLTQGCCVGLHLSAAGRPQRR